MKIFHWLGFHNILESKETGEIKYRYQSPFDLMITQFKQYQCSCGGKYWLPPGNFEEWRMQEFTYKLQTETARQLKESGQIEKAIEVLKL